MGVGAEAFAEVGDRVGDLVDEDVEEVSSVEEVADDWLFRLAGMLMSQGRFDLQGNESLKNECPSG